MLTSAALRAKDVRGDGTAADPADQLSVLRAGRRILQGSPPRTTATLALNQAAGRGNAQLVLLALNRLDAVALRAYQTSFFDFEGRAETERQQLLGVFDSAIAELERVSDRRQPVPVHGIALG